MRHKPLGRTGLFVSELCHPAMPIEETVRALDEVSRLPAEYPGWMFERQGDYRRRQLQDAVTRPGAGR